MCVIRLDDLPSWFRRVLKVEVLSSSWDSPDQHVCYVQGGLSAEMKLDPSQHASRLYCASVHRYITRVDRIR